MPIHDWTKVQAGIFHHFHHAWIEEITRSFNRGLLPPGYYALAEQLAASIGPDVLALHALQRPANGMVDHGRPQGGVRVAERMPKVRYHARTQTETYSMKAKAIVVRHTSDHAVIAMVEIMSPGNKSSQNRIQAFVNKASETLAAGVNLLIADLFPPTSRDPEGIHRLIWEDRDDEFAFSSAKPLTCASYIGDPVPEAFVEPIAIGDTLPEMPLFLTPEVYVNVALETTYQSAWAELPEVWRSVLIA
jgi:hypothetical protein